LFKLERDGGDEVLAPINVDLKTRALFIKNLLTMPKDYIYANSAGFCLSRNAREWSQCAVDFDRPNQVTTNHKDDLYDI
jgi:hypothetical protein